MFSMIMVTSYRFKYAKLCIPQICLENVNKPGSYSEEAAKMVHVWSSCTSCNSTLRSTPKLLILSLFSQWASQIEYDNFFSVYCRLLTVQKKGHKGDIEARITWWSGNVQMKLKALPNTYNSPNWPGKLPGLQTYYNLQLPEGIKGGGERVRGKCQRNTGAKTVCPKRLYIMCKNVHALTAF